MVTRADIIRYADENYNTRPEHPWQDYPGNEVLRHVSNKKWYALLMNVAKDKVGLDGEGTVDVMNVKCNPDMTALLLPQKGFSPAYHMNKQHWITVILDGTVEDGEIYNLLDLSYEMTKG